MTRTFARRFATVGGMLGIAILAGIGTASADATTSTAGPSGVVAQHDSTWSDNGDHSRCDDRCGEEHSRCDDQCGRRDCGEHEGLLDWLLGALI